MRLTSERELRISIFTEALKPGNEDRPDGERTELAPQ
jgi:hypothetical protein